MRKALALAGMAWLALRLLRRRGRGERPTVVVGYVDGSTLALDERSADRDRLLDLARVGLTR